MDLRSLERPGPDDAIRVEGLSLLRRHAVIIFGDGGACKSYLGLYLAGRLAEQGLGVGLFDWELAGEDHRDRLERLFGPVMPKISYVRCERPLTFEADRLRRIAHEENLDYGIFDSIAFACDGPPEAAEVAGRYFRAVRQIGPGSLHIAHISRSEGNEDKPFGSVFWSNSARSTWFAKLVESSPDGQKLSLGLFPKKANLGRMPLPAGFEITFEDDRTWFTRADPADTPDLAEKMNTKDRMRHLLRRGPMAIPLIADELDTTQDNIRRTVSRHNRMFTVLSGGKDGTQVALSYRDK